ncbi:ABC transporter substrate-binding protein [Dactylosporangium matsuzakiense]|uniref:ABC transporter substrate-binding protein n=1 Tax=Dactylosporangium matsuzakiense TaxID=53360 RepID=UPI0021C4BC81|nr:ABC transporter substrate-binding protein [Dactylosporangium matsuzakiense]UWZ41947.1 ABC transporter substrate-binding protein [Dactylosporangium matsuzakiense]
MRTTVCSAVVVAMLLAGGCAGKDSGTGEETAAGGYDAGLTRVVNPSATSGGTLRLASANDADSWDPTRSYINAVYNLQRLYVRTLLTPAAAPGTTALVPDLAEDQPAVSADGLTYTFRLRDDIKFEDGSPIRAKDVKYGIERLFAQDVLSGGPTYLIDQLDQGQEYAGPYRDGADLRSVTTPDDRTVAFHLAEPFADFPYLLAMGVAAPVPQAKDTGERYGDMPVASGPYRFESIEAGKKVVWVRNDAWDPATDPVRKALPDRIELTIGTEPNEIDRQLFDGTIDADAGQGGVQPASQAKIRLDPTLKANADEPTTGFVQYAALSTRVAPFDDIHCRRAVQYAVGKHAVQLARGGGQIAGGMLPPGIPGYDDGLDPYRTRSGQAQPDKAKDELKRCGKPDGFDTVIATTGSPRSLKTAEAVQSSLAAVGITARLDPSDPSLYARSTVGSPDNVHNKGYGIIMSAWSADFPTGYGFYPTLVDGRQIRPSGNNNYAELNDPLINQQLDEARTVADPVRAAGIWQQVDAEVMDSASMLPLVYDQVLNYRNPRLTNVFVNQYYGTWDVTALGVA